METHDHEEAFWLAQVRVGVSLSVLVVLILWGYLAVTPAEPYRTLFWVLVTAGGVVTAAAGLVPWRRVIARGWVLPVLYSWSASVTALLTLMTWLDGGRRSPVALLLVLPLAFGAMTYPPRAVVWLGAAIAGGQLLIALRAENGLVHGPIRAVTFALIAAMGVFTARNHTRQVERVRVLAAELRRQAEIDGLTGCLNHRTFHERLDAEVARAETDGGRLVLLSCDLDHFKRINDRHGHPIGDAALIAVGAALRDAVRDGDAVARVGGEEFALLITGVSLDAGFDLAERIRGAIGDIRVPASFTASLGVAAFPETATGKQDLLDAVDRALYAAKHAGRNRTVRAAPPGAEVDEGASQVVTPLFDPRHAV